MTLTTSNLTLFLIAAFILAITPGPGVIYVVTRTLRQGCRAGLASVLGIALGNFGNAAATSLGLAALIAASASAFMLIKLAGAAYLVYLGLKTLFAKSDVATPLAAVDPPVRLFADGFVVALLNPKTAIFFAALLPQFIDSAAAPLGQSLTLGAIFVSIALCTDSIYVLAAAALSRGFSGNFAAQPLGRYASAAFLIGLRVVAAVASPRSKH